LAPTASPVQQFRSSNTFEAIVNGVASYEPANMLWRKTKTIHLIRHGQSTFNVPPHDASIKDPYLTSTGRQQAETLGDTFPCTVDLIVCSPLRRALYTALYAFGDVLKTGNKKIIAIPELQELSKYPCDTGSSLKDLESEFRGQPVDFSLVHRSWDSKEGYWAPTARRSLERVKEVRQWLMNRPENSIVVVGHGHCIQLMAEEGSFHDIRNGLVFPAWQNTEYRSYHFNPEKDKDGASLIETKESLKRKERAMNIPRVGLEEMEPKSTTGGSSKKPLAEFIPQSVRQTFQTHSVVRNFYR
jgi:broad specificity phosphatase PhoE